jgi:hypothetical protein
MRTIDHDHHVRRLDGHLDLPADMQAGFLDGLVGDGSRDSQDLDVLSTNYDATQRFFMSTKAESESRLLSAAELEIVNITRDPEIGQLSSEQLKDVGRRLRQAHDRAKDISARQQREMRGKADPRGAKPAQDNTGTIAKAQVLFEAIQRLDAELSRREEVNTATPSQAELSRHALELKLGSKVDQHPDPGHSASQGMKTKERQAPPKIGTTKKEIGRVSQAGKVAQAHKDTPK